MARSRLFKSGVSDSGKEFEAFWDSGQVILRRKSDGDETVRSFASLPAYLASGDAKSKGLWERAIRRAARLGFSGRPAGSTGGTTSTVSGKGSKMTTIDVAVKAVKHGAKVAAADEAAEAVLDVVNTAVGDSLPPMLQTESGKSFLKVFGALVLHYAATETDVIPSGDNVAQACGLVIEASARDVLQPLVGKLRGKLGTLARIGARAAADAVQGE